jgi:MerR family transcriptional regulator, light-induced transcriptional regulator
VGIVKQYSIKDLEILSGIKAHTIRIWEKRYQLFDSNRTETNIRFYTCSELKKLLNISLLIDKGHKISKLSKMSEEAINENITTNFLNGQLAKDFYSTQINSMVLSMLELDENLFEKTFNGCVLRYGLENTILQVVYPFLKKVGMMWCINEVSPAQEHFTSNLIKQKIHTAIDGLLPATKTSEEETFLLYLNEEEDHDIGLLLAHYLLKTEGYKVIYLGPRVPYSDLEKIIQITNPSNLLTFFVLPKPMAETQEYCDLLSHNFPDKNIYLAGNPMLIDKLQLSPKSHHLESVLKLRELINTKA